MPLNFSCNIDTMFTEFPIEDRFERARHFGFNAVEIQNPYERSSEILRDRKGDLIVDLINMYAGPGPIKDGFASVPILEDDFMFSINMTSAYYPDLNYNKLHVLSGNRMENYTQETQVQTLIGNLNRLVQSEYLDNIRVIALIEPICSDVKPSYFLNSFELAIEVIQTINSDKIKLLLDIYHLHKITGDVKKYLEIYYPFAGHIQVSQEPNRCEPFCAGGEIDYRYVFDFLQQSRHQDFIGLEYYPSGSYEESFTWMNEYAR